MLETTEQAIRRARAAWETHRPRLERLRALRKISQATKRVKDVAATALPTPGVISHGPQLWGTLHRYALSADLSGVANWLDRFASAIPCGECRRHWQEIERDSPPQLGSPAEFFAWTVAAHNSVNRRLGKPEMTVKEAERIWRLEPGITEPVEPRSQWKKNRRRNGFVGFAAAPAEVRPLSPSRDLENFFDAVWCINLDAEVERWRTMQRQIAECQWPFRSVTRFSAIHGDTVGVPDHFHQGGGAWGCLSSHRRVLEMSLMAGHQRILVMEDDADIRRDFGRRVSQFLSDLGDEQWDCLMLGGQHMSSPKPLRPGVVRCANTQRTHCMAFSRNFMRELYRYWSGPLDQHCDWALGPFAGKWRTFAPEKFIVGQRGGKSWITGREKAPEWWNAPPADAPVVWLRCPREVIEQCRDKFHAGNRRNSEGVCVGLADVFDTAKNPTKEKQIAALRSWIEMIQWEVESRGDGSVCTIWNPAATEDVVRAAAGEVLTNIELESVEKMEEMEA